MTKMELKDAYYWEIKLFYENGSQEKDLADLLELVYRGGYYDGFVEAKDKEYE